MKEEKYCICEVRTNEYSLQVDLQNGFKSLVCAKCNLLIQSVPVSVKDFDAALGKLGFSE